VLTHVPEQHRVLAPHDIPSLTFEHVPVAHVWHMAVQAVLQQMPLTQWPFAQ
jgi:hypothetical protein